MNTQEQIELAEQSLKQVEEALARARRMLSDARLEMRKYTEHYNRFVSKLEMHKKHFDYLPIGELGEWAIRDIHLEAEHKALKRRESEIGKRLESLDNEIKANEAGRSQWVRELELAKMPEGKAQHIRIMSNRM